MRAVPCSAQGSATSSEWIDPAWFSTCCMPTLAAGAAWASAEGQWGGPPVLGHSSAMAVLNAAGRQVIDSGALAHLVTINEDGSPQVSVVWVGLDGDELVSAHLDARQRKLQNLRRDPRVVVSFEGPGANAIGMRNYLVVHGVARITEGGAPQLLHRQAQTYVGPGTVFPPMPDPPPGFISHITISRIGGSGPWIDGTD